MNELDELAVEAEESSSVLRTPGAEPPVRRTIAWCRSLGPRGRGAAAFLLYALVSIVSYGFGALPHFSSRCATACVHDTKFFVWSLAWMPYALAHGLSPFHTGILSAPGSVDLTWVVTVPGPALVMAPVTKVFGPVASYNALVLAAPALAGWAAYLVCNQATRRFWPSVAGGFVFGFTSYVERYMRVELHALLIFPAALAVYLVLRRIDGSMSKRAFVALLALVLVVQLSISTELFATMTLFGAIALLGAFILGPRLSRTNVLSVVGLIGLAYLAVGVVASPYLYEAIRHRPVGSLRDPANASSDLLSFVLPPRSAWIGGSTLRGVTAPFIGTWNMAYLGPVFIIILCLFAWGARRQRTTWLLVGFVTTVAVLSLGPRLHIAGTESVPMPAALITRLPLLHSALPGRWVGYLWLGMAVIVALWLCGGQRRTAWMRYVVVGLALLVTGQSVDYPPAPRQFSVPAFFTDGTYRSYLRPGEIVLPITQDSGDDLLWQAAAGMYFRMPQGTWPLVQMATGRDLLPAWIYSVRSSTVEDPPSREALVRFLAEHQVEAIVATDPLPPAWSALLQSTVSTEPVTVDGVSVYEVP